MTNHPNWDRLIKPQQWDNGEIDQRESGKSLLQKERSNRDYISIEQVQLRITHDYGNSKYFKGIELIMFSLLIKWKIVIMPYPSFANPNLSWFHRLLTSLKRVLIRLRTHIQRNKITSSALLMPVFLDQMRALSHSALQARLQHP